MAVKPEDEMEMSSHHLLQCYFVCECKERQKKTDRERERERELLSPGHIQLWTEHDTSCWTN